jgi:hypothetical protein
MSSCYRTSNNKFASAPARMADGRHFTDYRPSCHLNAKIQIENQVPNSYEFRMFLTRNAEDLMELNRKQSYLANGAFECKPPYNVGTMLPESHKVKCNAQTCEVSHNYENGLGLGRDYGEGADCLASFNAPAMKLDENQCRPPSFMDYHKSDRRYDEPVVSDDLYMDANNRISAEAEEEYGPSDFTNNLSLY